MEKHSKIYIAGHRGLVGSAIIRELKKQGYENLVYKTSIELDLCRQTDVEDFFAQEHPDYVFLCAAKVGGILANSTYPADFIYQNTMISTNIIHASYKHNVKKLLNMGSSCIYPRSAPQPMKEDCLLSSALEPTNEAYAIAKIAAIKLCLYYNKQYGSNFISAMPTNQYGINDNFNMETAHLLPMVMRRFHLAKLLSQSDFGAIKKDFQKYPLGWGLDEKFIKGEWDFDNKNHIEKALNTLGAYKEKVVMWGDGSVYRELMNSDDLANACVYLMQNKDFKDIGELVNITNGDDIKLSKLFEIVREIIGFNGIIEYDKTKPNGTPRKSMDSTKIFELGWKPSIKLYDGIERIYNWYATI